MVVVDERRRRALVDQVVKREVVEPDYKDQMAWDHDYDYDHDHLQHHQYLGLHPHNAEEEEPEDNLTLAQLSKTPKPKSDLTTDKQNKLMETKYKLLNIKNSMSKHAISGQASKFASSMKAAMDGTCSRGEARSSAVIRAEEVRANLEAEFPSFVKSLVRSHVASCFWMGLPALFCKRHLPDKDSTITLEDESGKEYNMKYIAYKTGLSAGWRQFSVVHKLQEGDVLVFQLVEPTKFKVYIIRANDLSELDGALSLLHLDSYTKQREGDKDNPNADAVAHNSSKRKHAKSVPQVVQKKKKTSVPKLAPKVRRSAEQSENDSEEVHSEVLEGFKPMLQFKNVKFFKDFSVQIDGIPIDAELHDEIRIKYYKLCSSQHAFLHDNLIEGMNYQLIVGIISETVNIADAIKASTVTTSRVEFAKWDKTLLAFQQLGMNVEFLRLRLRRLVSIAYEKEGASESRRYLESRTEHSRADDEIKNMETKLEELKGACNVFGAYLESLKYKAECYQLKFQEEVTAPW